MALGWMKVLAQLAIRMLPHPSARRVLLLLIAILLLPGSASYLRADEITGLVERSRAAQAMQLHLMAADLLDELIYQWSRENPLRGGPSKVALKRLSTPVGLNQQLGVFLENHLYNLLQKNPKSGLIPTYCGYCLELVSYSTADETLIARGAAIPNVLEKAKKEAPYGLYIDIEASGSDLILRAYLSDLSTNQIIAAKSLVTNSSHPPLLRLAKNLSSIEDTRLEYTEILQGRRRWSLLAGIRTSLLQTTSRELTALPFIWGQVGIEAISNNARKWTADLQVGAASLPGEYNAYQISSRIYRLVNAETIDLIAPNLYTYIGLGYWELDGNSALFFQNTRQLSPGAIVERTLQKQSRPRSHNSSLTLGLEVRLADLFRFGLFAESFINQDNNENFSDTLDAYGLDFGVIL